MLRWNMPVGYMVIASELSLKRDGGLQVIVMETVIELRLKMWEQ